MDDSHEGESNTADQVNVRQRDRFNDLWSQPRSKPLSPDRIRYRVWQKYLVPPIVEVGAGDGLLARTYLSKRIVSVDQSITGLRSAPDPKTIGTLENLPIKNDYANTIVAAEVLEHVGDPLAALAECRRIARQGALLLLSVPVFPLAFPEALFHRFRIGEWPSTGNLRRWDPEHERRYDHEELLCQLCETGWEPLKLVPLFGFAASALMYFGESATDRMLGRRLPLAQLGASCDRLWSNSTRHSALAVVCRRTLSNCS